ncbi:PstS family phosphate ABC transporter substrate-binding protein [Pseudoalteromonas sp. SWYJZ12]|uniref:PstS family phosphate ABC transporter substrate-binding protein n=1 Tax=Pseudoalteromonas sp. SWYJZ12 TaxID=2792067 RepID=UPI0018CFDA56|nr:substrate-binding domain-containing protein [Pseudoalteromonas sp. SWYJZ12]MBH0002007.1 substrate-binding domain-containing protein [Pseudoalteromonas sp. SWYJZ12]
MIKNLILAVSMLTTTPNTPLSDNPVSKIQKPLLVGGSSSVAHLLDLIKPDYQAQTNIPMQIRSMGSEKGIKAIAENFVDIGATSRFLTNHEQEIYPHVRQIIIAQDALVFFTNTENNIKSLSVEQLANIYAGKYETWQKINPNYSPKTARDNKILLLSKAPNHGTFNILLEFLELNYMKIPNGNTIKFKKTGNRGLYSKKEAQLYDEFNQALGIVQRMPNAIAYDSYGAVSQLLGSKKIDKVNILAVNGISVNDQSIINGDYTLVRPLILLINSESERSIEQAELLISIIKTKKNRQILAENHYLLIDF